MIFGMVIYFFITGGFGALAAAEFAAMGGGGSSRPGFLPFFEVSGYLGVGAALAMHSAGPFGPAGAGMPRGFLGWAALAVAAASLAMLVWTVFLEIPRERRLRRVETGRAVTTGSYGVCRHPGWWWFSFYSLALCAARPQYSRLDSALLMIACNFALVLLQDRWSFPARFADYREYSERTPFLVPRPSRRTQR